MSSSITNAYHGLRLFRPLKSAISSASKPSRASSRMMPNVPSVVST